MLASLRRKLWWLWASFLLLLVLVLWNQNPQRSNENTPLAKAVQSYHSTEKLRASAQKLNDRAITAFSGTSAVAKAVQTGAALVNEAAQRKHDEAFLRLLAEKVDAAIAREHSGIVSNLANARTSSPLK
jgi:hypothetical protein